MALIVKDFTALETTEKCKNHQDLIFTIYLFNPANPNHEEISNFFKIKLNYFDFLKVRYNIL